eukprot:CAMPEP_0113971972 /NCGR_PEP_ID=MMETSP0011_2-20120614/12807_1 /TAXON_ID=101924 /ORGANISM="Rhodosorus marinus" /LENGTH=123 /DNA_ID=CAMNT_0000988075 /DNA_START=120 /DNA_END=488 /DNA_ORIENTATION=- /assembly_acc=CAM_ASM_000156
MSITVGSSTSTIFEFVVFSNVIYLGSRLICSGAMLLSRELRIPRTEFQSRISLGKAWDPLPSFFSTDTLSILCIPRLSMDMALNLSVKSTVAAIRSGKRPTGAAEVILKARATRKTNSVFIVS